MGIQKLILNFVLTIESFFLSFLKIKKNRVTFISLESKVLTSDFKLIYDELVDEQLDIQLCLTYYQKSLKHQFFYFFNCLKQLYYVYTSTFIVLHDNNYVVSHFKRKGTTVLQVWHACGAIKKFGNVIDRKYMISNYDYVLSPSSFWKQPYSEAFSVSQEDVLPIGMPRTDQLFNQDWIHKNQEELYKKYPDLRGKKIILYAPTFRGNIYKGFSSIEFDAKKLLDDLGNDYVLIYKFHPLLGNYQLMSSKGIMNMNHEDTHALFTVSDYLISDYSSIVFDYMILEKPILFYVPDYQEYMEYLGVFVDINELRLPICQNIQDIVKTIQNDSFEKENMTLLKRQFFDIQDGKSSKRVAQFIKDKINGK